MIGYVIIPATAAHAHDLVARLRPGDRAEMLAVAAATGVLVRDQIVGSVARSAQASAAVETSGEVIAVWGITAGSLLADTGRPWLLTGAAVERHKRAFMRESYAWIHEMQARFPRLENFVDTRYTRCLRWLDWLGFTLHPSTPQGGVAFCRAERLRC